MRPASAGSRAGRRPARDPPRAAPARETRPGRGVCEQHRVPPDEGGSVSAEVGNQGRERSDDVTPSPCWRAPAVSAGSRIGHLTTAVERSRSSLALPVPCQRDRVRLLSPTLLSSKDLSAPCRQGEPGEHPRLLSTYGQPVGTGTHDWIVRISEDLGAGCVPLPFAGRTPTARHSVRFLILDSGAAIVGGRGSKSAASAGPVEQLARRSVLDALAGPRTTRRGRET